MTDTTDTPDTREEPGIDESFVPVAVDLPIEEFGDRHVLYHADQGRLTWLNQTAALIWSACDGTVPLSVLIDELAAAYQVDRSDVADDVVESVRQLMADGALTDEAHLPAADGFAKATGPTGPPLPSRGCAPCLTSLDALGWSEPFGIMVGDTLVGLRANDDRATGLVRSLLADRLTDHPPAMAHLSVRLPDPDEAAGGTRELCQLYEVDELLARSRSGADVVGHLLIALERWVPPGVNAAPLLLHTGAVVTDEGAVIAPPMPVADVAAVARKVGGRALPPPLFIDPTTARLVIPTVSPSRTIGSAFEEICAVYGGPGSESPPPAGTREINHLLLGPWAEPTPESALGEVCRLMTRGHASDPTTTLSAAKRLVTGTAIDAVRKQGKERSQLRRALKTMTGR